MVVTHSRKFKYKGETLTDPNINYSKEEVLSYYSNQYPELINANVDGPTIDGDDLIYEFKINLGVKG